MHEHLEIIMPPTDDIEASVKRIMAQFDENAEGEEKSSCPFWDFYVIGGRMAGIKTEVRIDKEKLGRFQQWLKSEGITVAGFQAGKPELSPASQIPKVDAMWHKITGLSGPCMLFNHSNDQFGRGLDGSINGDICTLAELPDELTADRVIFATPQYNSETGKRTSPPKAGHMEQRQAWNGVNYITSTWDGLVKTAVSNFLKELDGMNPDYVATQMPKPDWLVVTVDYHT
jgi:hypothetical protein